jgi:hypothetical protein
MHGLPADERFRRQVKKTDGCWIWAAAIDRDGYGRFSATIHGERFTKAHRYSWALANGRAIPKEMHVCHSCDNPRCVNPAHLWLGTNEDNMKDKISKGRHVVNHVRGETHVDAKITEDQARAILADPRPHSEIAADYGLKPSTISSIKTRRSWAHLDVDFVAKAKRVSPNKGKSDKVTPEIVRDIRSSQLQGNELAKKYGISVQLVSHIRHRKRWQHID